MHVLRMWHPRNENGLEVDKSEAMMTWMVWQLQRFMYCCAACAFTSMSHRNNARNTPRPRKDMNSKILRAVILMQNCSSDRVSVWASALSNTWGKLNGAESFSKSSRTLPSSFGNYSSFYQRLRGLQGSCSLWLKMSLITEKKEFFYFLFSVFHCST